jgi:hypothetical protein
MKSKGTLPQLFLLGKGKLIIVLLLALFTKKGWFNPSKQLEIIV